MTARACISYLKSQLLDQQQRQTDSDKPLSFDLSIALEFKLATWVAFQLPLPDGPVEELHQYYSTHVRGRTNELVQQLNEETVLNVSRILKEIYRQWTLRYNTLYRPFHYTTQRHIQWMVEEANDNSLDPDYRQALTDGLYAVAVDYDMKGE